MRSSNEQACPRPNAIPPFLRCDDLQRQFCQFIPVLKDGRPVACAESIAAVNHSIDDQHSIRKVRQHVQDSRRKECNSSLLSFRETRKRFVSMEELAPVCPYLKEPTFELAASARIAGRDNFAVGKWRDGELPKGPLAGCENTSERRNVILHAFREAGGGLNCLVNTLPVVESEVDDTGVQEHPMWWLSGRFTVHLGHSRRRLVLERPDHITHGVVIVRHPWGAA